MDEISVDERWRELVALYRDKADEELLDLRADFDDLTEIAQGALRDEMKRRGIWSEVVAPTTPVAMATFSDEDAVLAAAEEAAASDDEESPEPGEEWRRYDSDTVMLGGVVVHICADEREEALCRFLLDRARIQSVVMSGYGQLKVPPDDEARAVAVLERGASPAVMAEFEKQYAAEEADGGFEVPVCKKCGSSEVMLESIDPVNQWVCGDCGNSWQDALAEDGDKE